MHVLSSRGEFRLCYEVSQFGDPLDFEIQKSLDVKLELVQFMLFLVSRVHQGDDKKN